MEQYDFNAQLWPAKNSTDPAEVASRYDSGADQYAESVRKDGWESTFRMMENEINEMFDESQNSRITVLDAGCGDGLLVELYPFRGKNISLTGFDFSPKMLDIAKKRSEYEKFVYGNCDEPLSFPDNYFDRVIANGLLGYTAKTNAFIEFKRILKPGGKMLINMRKHHFEERGYPKLLSEFGETLKTLKKEFYDPFPNNPEYTFVYQYGVFQKS